MKNSNRILSVDNLAISFHQKNKDIHVVKDISFDIEDNETVALVGESGSGKSLTAYSIMRLLPYPKAFHPSGKIVFREKDLIKQSLKSMVAIRGKDVGMIFQEPMSALNPLQTIGKQIAEVINIHQVGVKKNSYQAVIKLLEQVHIKDPEAKFNAYPHQLSGGQRQRAMIAMALANKPKLLIADEPTTALDVTIQKEILDLLKELQTQYEMSILLITHDLRVVKYMADRVLVMQQGEIVERGDTQQVLKFPVHDYTKLLINSHPNAKPIKLDAANETLPNILTVESLGVTFPKNKPLFGKCRDFFHALEDVDLTLPQGCTLGVLGESGSGKSTLALAVLRLLKSTGKIILGDQCISDLSETAVRPLRSNMQMVFQDPFSSLSPRMSVAQIISEGLQLQKTLSAVELDDKVDTIMREVGLDPMTKHRYPHEFSGGQRQRIAIARAFILNPKLVFLDEPTSALDRVVQVQIIELLQNLQKQRNLSYVFISHDIHVIQALSHHIIVIKNGEIVEKGNANQILTAPQHPYTKKLLTATLH